MKAPAPDPMPVVEQCMTQVRLQMERVAELLAPLGMRMRVLISLETVHGATKQWKISTETPPP